jgi:hypothetical protein
MNELSISHSFSGELQTPPVKLICQHSVTLEHYHIPAGALSLSASKLAELNPTPIYPNITPTEIGTYNALVNNLPLILVAVILYKFHDFFMWNSIPLTSQPLPIFLYYLRKWKDHNLEHESHPHHICSNTEGSYYYEPTPFHL